MLTAMALAQVSSNVRTIGYYETPGFALGVTVSGGCAYVADDASGLRIYQGYGPAEVADGPGSWCKVCSLKLLPNAPNSFGQIITIIYQLTRSGKVSLKVYNLAGQCVRDLTAASPSLEGRDSWMGFVVWDGRDKQGVRVSNGVYVCRLEAKEGSQSRKMVLMR
jgi:hypothetical protein